MAKSTTEGEDNKHIRCILKKFMSLQTEHRENGFFQELKDTRWDFVFLNGTWREKKEELWKNADGHRFLGSGGTHGRNGVAILMHKDLPKFK